MATPVELLLKVMTHDQVAEVCGVTRQNVYYWETSVMRGQTTGYIPSMHIPKLYAWLQEQKIPMSLERLCGVPPRKRSGRAIVKPQDAGGRHFAG